MRSSWAINEEYLKFILDQLSKFGEVEVKRMFGGIGLFHQGLMFGKIGGDTFRLKVDKHNQKEYEDKGVPCWGVPLDILENKDELVKWAKRSFEAAVRNQEPWSMLSLKLVPPLKLRNNEL